MVMLPWRNNVNWLTPASDENVSAEDTSQNKMTFLGYTGKLHKNGMFVVRTRIERNQDNEQSWRRWMKYGPEPISGACDVVLYFTPRCTPNDNVQVLLPDYEQCAKVC
jgi:hypothetical protein